FDERADWTKQNLERIRALARDPSSGLQPYPSPTEKHPEAHKLGWLGQASDPFQFLAHAIELDRALKEGPGFVTTLPIAFDASNSGAQHYSLLIRDPLGARLTNLAPDDPEKIEDLYLAVRRKTIVDLDEHLGDPTNYPHAMIWAARGRSLT